MSEWEELMSDWEELMSELMKDAEEVEIKSIGDNKLTAPTIFYLKEYKGEWLCEEKTTQVAYSGDTKEEAIKNLGDLMFSIHRIRKKYPNSELSPRLQTQKQELIKLFGSQDE